jgi:hypothetical protein
MVLMADSFFYVEVVVVVGDRRYVKALIVDDLF